MKYSLIIIGFSVYVSFVVYNLYGLSQVAPAKYEQQRRNAEQRREADRVQAAEARANLERREAEERKLENARKAVDMACALGEQPEKYRFLCK